MVLCGDSFNYGIGCVKTMNQRIKDLYILADRFALDKANNTSHEEFEYSYDDVMLGKFAELIVLECVNVVEGGSFLHDQAPTAIFAKECSAAIKRHFDIK